MVCADFKQSAHTIFSFPVKPKFPQKFVAVSLQKSLFGNVIHGKYTDITELTPTTVNELIKRIEIHKREKRRSEKNIQQIDIYYNFVASLASRTFHQLGTNVLHVRPFLLAKLFLMLRLIFAAILN